MMKRTILAALAASTCILTAAPASAVIWTDWTSQGANTVGGTVGGVGVTYTGSYIFTQLAGGTNYWAPWPGAAGPAPTGTDIIALNLGGTKTITFASAVNDVYFAINSWNVPTAAGGPSTTTFDKAYSVVGIGCGYWGCGSLLNPTATTFESNGQNEIHGTIKFAGPITSLTFTDGGDENWHGFTIGIGSVNGAVPEPATWAMMIGGFGVVGAAMRRRRRTVLATA